MTQQKEPIKISPELLSACIHCGLCLSSCPTYLASGREMESPRGRIYLMNMLENGEAEAEPRLVEHLDSCLGCLGCQTACPSGVQYGKLLDQARPLIAAQRPAHVRRLMRFAFQHILPDYRRLHFLSKVLRLWQKTGLDRLPEKLPWLAAGLGKLAEWQEFLPPVPVFKPLPKQSWIPGDKQGEVQVFSGCVMDVFYNDVNHACVRLLAAQRRMVNVPEQTCCGALAFHAGETDIARDLARENIEYFEKTAGDIVVTAAGCGAMLKEYGELLHDDPQWHARAHQFAARVRDVTEALAEKPIVGEPHAIDKKVAYHAACHLSHAQGVRQPPLDLLKQIPGVKPVPLEEAEHCCGSAGIYNLMHTDMSMEILERKMDNIERTGADIIVTTNPGCLLQLQKGLRDRKCDMKACHLIELLDEAYRLD
ncbi:MAG TPA: heterodisulfide reductase-related iron-sulfur binding cluster [Candidatus Obscuribacterales bacterium]